MILTDFLKTFKAAANKLTTVGKQLLIADAAALETARQGERIMMGSFHQVVNAVQD